MFNTRLTHLRPATRVALAATVVAALAVGATGCSEDDADAAPDAPTAETVEVVATDFHFGGLPDTVIAGSKIAFENAAPTELHELVAIRLPDGEERSLDELIALPENEFFGLLTAGPPALVVLAAPDGDPVIAVGDGTLTQPGRYLLICGIPTGVEPGVYLAAAAESGDGPPTIEGGGPPHFVHGMYAELEVVAS
jgi:hypothetical protein